MFKYFINFLPFMYEEILMDIGFTKNEAKTYIALLNLGLATATKISKNSGLHRANVYDSLKKLSEKGFVTHIQKENTSYYSATNPQSLLRIIKEKENNLKTILPQLMLTKKLAGSTGEAHIFESVTSFMNLLHNLLDYKEEILVYGIPKLAPGRIKTKIPHFHKKRISLDIDMKHIYNHNAKERIEILNNMKNTFAKYLPKSFDSQVSTTICGEEVILTLWHENLINIQIKNKSVANSYKKYFELLWNAAK